MANTEHVQTLFDFTLELAKEVHSRHSEHWIDTPTLFECTTKRCQIYRKALAEMGQALSLQLPEELQLAIPSVTFLTFDAAVNYDVMDRYQELFRRGSLMLDFPHVSTRHGDE